LDLRGDSLQDAEVLFGYLVTKAFQTIFHHLAQLEEILLQLEFPCLDPRPV